MKKNYGWVWLAAFFLMSANTAGAYPARSSEYPWYLFLGGDLGYSHYSAYNSSTTEAPRGGFDGGFRALIAHYSTDWVIDGGLGIQWISNQGTNGDGTTNKDNTTNAYIDLSPRYRFAHISDLNFQLGPELEYWVATDKGLNPTPAGSNIISDGSNTSAWIGLQAILEWGDNNKFRVGARGLTAINVSERTVTLGQVFFQFGFDVFHTSNASPQKNYERITADDLDRVEDRSQKDPLAMTPEPTPWPNTAPATPEPIPEVVSTPAPPEVDATPYPTPVATPEPIVKAKPAAKIILTLDVNDLPFGFNNANLPKANAARVRKIGEFLKQNNKLWKSLVVGGYTDERGSKPYNLKLSKNRADAVRNLLVEGGASPKKIKVVGYGESHPRDRRHNENAWAKNRRVELEFKGVKDMVLMKKAMKQ
jgi:outer membrane protein OmpA-like peptidoglycan-associated protein